MLPLTVRDCSSLALTPFTQLLFQFQPNISLNSCHTSVQCIVFCGTLIPRLALLSLSCFSFSPATPWTSATQQSYALYAVWPSPQAPCCSQSYYMTCSTDVRPLNFVMSFVEMPHTRYTFFMYHTCVESGSEVDSRLSCRKKSGISIQSVTEEKLVLC